MCGLVDEASKLNLNTVTSAMLSNLIDYIPEFTVQHADSIIDWRDSDDEPGTNGFESEYYLRLNPAYRLQEREFRERGRVAHGRRIDRLMLYGEDANLNGVLDPNENDGNITPPFDNRDGRLDYGCRVLHRV